MTHHLIHPLNRNQYITEADNSDNDHTEEGKSCLNEHFTTKFCGGANQTQLEFNKESRPTQHTT